LMEIERVVPRGFRRVGFKRASKGKSQGQRTMLNFKGVKRRK